MSQDRIRRVAEVSPTSVSLLWSRTQRNCIRFAAPPLRADRAGQVAGERLPAERASGGLRRGSAGAQRRHRLSSGKSDIESLRV